MGVRITLKRGLQEGSFLVMVSTRINKSGEV